MPPQPDWNRRFRSARTRMAFARSAGGAPRGWPQSTQYAASGFRGRPQERQGSGAGRVAGSVVSTTLSGAAPRRPLPVGGRYGGEQGDQDDPLDDEPLE